MVCKRERWKQQTLTLKIGVTQVYMHSRSGRNKVKQIVNQPETRLGLEGFAQLFVGEAKLARLAKLHFVVY